MISYKQLLQQGQSNEKAKDYFGVLASLALLIVLLLVLFPAIKHITEINKEVSDARITKAGLESKLEALGQARANYEEVKGDLPLLDLAVPVGSTLPPYLKNIEDLVSKSGMRISNVQFSNVPLAKIPKTSQSLKTGKVSYALTLDGDFLNFEQFLLSLEKFIRISDVTSINIEKAQDSNGIQSSLNIDTYFLSVPTTTTNSSTNSGSGNAK